MFSFGVTLWEIFSGHTPYDTNAKSQKELKASLHILLKDSQNPLRPDLNLVDPRVRPLLQVSSFALKCVCGQLISSTAALLGHGSQRQNQRC
jgi:hypothetical protein